jgi:DNA-binding response OmpR family regulator
MSSTSEFNLLSVLVRRACRVFTRDEIMDHLKGHEWTPLDRTIDALIARLRRKIEPQNETPRLLKTVRGVGYAFAVEARRV